MKLHLPSGLRAALIACFAAFAGVGTTISTATITGGVFAVTIAGQAMAADIPAANEYGDIWLKGEEYTLTDTVNITDYLIDTNANNPRFKVDSNMSVSIRVGAWWGYGGGKEYTKTGDGTLVIAGLSTVKSQNREAESPGKAIVTAGTLELAYEGSLTTVEATGGTALVSSALSVTNVNVSGGTLKNTGTLTATNVNMSSGSFVNEGALTVNGTLTLSSAIQMGSGSSFSMSEGATLDLSNLAPDEEGGNTFTLLAAAPGVTDAQLDLSSLAGINIIGISAEGGMQWTFGTDGKLTYTTIAPIVYGGGTLEWNTTDANFTQNGAQVAFSNGGYVVFEATSDVTVQGALSANGIEVNAGATVSLALGKYNDGESEKDSTLDVSRLVLNGAVEIKNNNITFERIDAGENAEVIINWGGSGNGAKWTDANLGSYSGKVLVKNGNFSLVSGNQYKLVTVENGGRADITENATYVGDFSIAGMGASGNPGALSLSKGATVDGKVTVRDAGSDVATAIAVWNAGVGTVKGTLDLQGALQVGANNWSNGTLRLMGDITGGAGISVAHGALQIGDLKSATTKLETGDISLAENVTLVVHHGGGSLMAKNAESGAVSDLADMSMAAGSVLHIEDVSANGAALKVATLSVSAGEGKQCTIQYNHKGGVNVGVLTGSANIELKHAASKVGGPEGGKGGGDHRVTTFESLNNYAGTITDNATEYNHKVVINSVTGDTTAAKVVGTVHSADFSKTGAGSFAADALSIDEGGKLTANYEGTLDITTLSLGNTFTLAYTSTTGSVLSLGADLFEYQYATDEEAAAGGKNKVVTLDVSALDQEALSGGLNTGIASTVDETIFTLALGEGALEGANVRFEKDETNGVWKLVCDKPVDTSVWNWATPGDTGVWADASADGWTVGEGDTPSGRNVVFGADGLGVGSATTVKIAGEVKAASILVETAVGKTYTFTGDGDDATTNDGIAAGALTKSGEGTLVIATTNSSADALTIEAGTVQIGTADAGADWVGAIKVNGSSTLDVTKATNAYGSLWLTGAVTAEDGATVKVAGVQGGMVIASIGGGNLVVSPLATGGGKSNFVTVKDVTGDFVSVTNNGPGTLELQKTDVGDAGTGAHIGTLVNKGTISSGTISVDSFDNTGTVGMIAGAKLTIDNVVNGGTITLGDNGVLSLNSNATFTAVNPAGGSVANSNQIVTSGKTVTLEGSSNIGSVSSSSDTATSLVLKGATTTMKGGTLQTLTLASNAKLTSTSGSLNVLGDIVTDGDASGTASGVTFGSGSITVGGDATVAGTMMASSSGTGASVSIGGNANISGDLYGAHGVAVTGSATVGGDLKTQAVDYSGAAYHITVGGSATVTGNVSAGGNVTLGKGGTIGDISATTGNLVLAGDGKLTLGGALTVGGTVSGVKRIEVMDAAALTGTVVSAGGLTMGDALTFAFSSGTLSPVTAGAADVPYTLFTLTDTSTAIDTLLGTDLSKLALEVAGENVEVVNKLSVKIDTTTYTLGIDAASNSIILLASNTGLVWNVPSDGADATLSQGSSDEFGGAANTGLKTDADLIFNGGGATGTDDKAGTVNVDGGVQVGSVTIDAADTTYTFSGEEGDSLTTETLNIKNGNVENEMTLTVTGAVAAADSVIENTGTFSVGEGSEIGGITGDGEVIATGSALIGSIDGATSLTTTNSGSTPTTVTLLDITSPIALDIAANTTVSVSPSTTFALFAGTNDLVLTSLTSGGTLNAPDKNVILQQKATNGGTLTALSLNLEGAKGSTFTSITTDTLTLDASALSSTTTLLTTDSLASLSGNAITLTLTGITDAVAGGLAYDNYLLISGLTAKVDIAALSDDLRQLFALSDKESYAQYAWVENAGKWDLVLSVKQDDPRYWTGGDLANGGSDDKWAGSLGDDDKPQHVLDLSKLDRYEALDTVDNVRLDENTTIDLTAATLDTTKNPDGLIIRQLEGTADLTLTGDAADLATLDNTAGATTLGGDLTVQGMQVVAQGGNALTVGDLTVEKAGSLTVAGTGSMIAEKATANGGSITVEQGGKLDVDSMTITGTGASVTNNGTFEADSLTLDSSSATFNAAAGTTNVGALNGTTGKIDGTINVNGTGGSYAGNYGSNAAIVLGSATGAAEQNITIGAATTGSENLAVSATKDAELTLTYTDGGATLKSLSADGATIVLDNAGANTLTVMDTVNSTLKNGNLGFNLSATDVANGVALEVTKGLNLDGTTVWVSQMGAVRNATFDVTKGTEGWTLFTLTDGTVENVTVKLDETDPFFQRYFEAGSVRVEGGVVKADLITDYYTSDLAQTENGTEGMEMLDAAALAANPQAGDLADVIKSLDSFKNPATRDAAAADKLASAVAGSGLASLGMALAGDVERQLKAIRNRTTTMGVDPAVVNEEMPYFNAWINAEGDYRSMDDDGMMAGYTVNTYGGTVGFDMDVTPELTWGLALTAMYGDFDSDTVDMVEGDMDTYYVSAFARAMSGAWTHTFVATVGISQSELNRTVTHNSGSYTAEGEADGISFGLLYEVARTYALNEDATACWQPVFNVAYRHIEVDGYDETGSDAALRVGDQSLDTVTFGLGARLQAVVGESIYNRTSIFEARALVKFDAGDRESEMENALLAAPGTSAKVKSAEMDAVGLEVGAGLTVPVGFDAGSIFVDGSLEFRGSYTNFNAAAGYRVNF